MCDKKAIGFKCSNSQAISFTWCLWRRQDENSGIVFHHLIKKKERKNYRWSDCSLQLARELLYLLTLRKVDSDRTFKCFSLIIRMQKKRKKRNRIIYNLRVRFATLVVKHEERTNWYMYHYHHLRMYHVYFHKFCDNRKTNCTDTNRFLSIAVWLRAGWIVFSFMGNCYNVL